MSRPDFGMDTMRSLLPIRVGMLALGLAATLPVTAAEIYRWVDAGGVVHFGQTPAADPALTVQTIRIENTNPPDWDPVAFAHGQSALMEQNNARLGELAVRFAPDPESSARVGADIGPEPGADDGRHADRGPAVYLVVPPGPRHRPRHHGGRHTGEPPGKVRAASAAGRAYYPLLSHRMPGAGLRFGYLAHRYTHRNK